MPLLVSALVRLLAQQVLRQLAVAAVHEVAKRTGDGALHDAAVTVAGALGVTPPVAPTTAD